VTKNLKHELVRKRNVK